MSHSVRHSVSYSVEKKRHEDNRVAYTLDDVLRMNTGRFLIPSKFSEGYQRQKLLQMQQDRYADILEAAGISVRVDSNISMISDVTKQVEDLQSYRNINFLPLVAQKNRRKILYPVQHFLENEADSYWRYAVITSGTRCTIDELSERQDDFKYRVKEWRRLAARHHDIEFGLVGWEYTINEDGLFHFHANILFKPPFMRDGGKSFYNFSRKYLGTWWKDAGRIENIRELVKYPFKPSELDYLSEEDIVKLFYATFGRRFFEVLGPIAEHRNYIKDKGYKYFGSQGQIKLRKSEPLMKTEKSKDEFDRSSPENIILARIPPNFSNCLWSESSTLVMNYNPKTVMRKSQERLLELQLYQHEARQSWDEAGAPDPQTALVMTKAALDAGDADTNVRALWKRSGLYSTQLDDNWDENLGSEGDHHDFFNETELIEADPPDNVVNLFG